MAMGMDAGPFVRECVGFKADNVDGFASGTPFTLLHFESTAFINFWDRRPMLERSPLMIRQTLATLALATVVGCSSGNMPFTSGHVEEQSQLAAYAATAKYPDAKPSSDIRAAALINPKDSEIKVVNFSDAPLRNVNVWVNGTFVHNVAIIPAHGATTIARENFFDGRGDNMSKMNVTASRVEVQTGDQLFNLGTVTTE